MPDHNQISTNKYIRIFGSFIHLQTKHIQFTLDWVLKVMHELWESYILGSLPCMAHINLSLYVSFTHYLRHLLH